jgi:aldehyde:ferredoxin oxidoreductase
MTVGERAYNMERAFNALFGHARKDDTLCDQWMKEPIPKGLPGEGMKGEDCFDLMMDEYYGYRGMDTDTGLQTRTQLETLGLKEIADILEKRNALSSTNPRPRDELVAEARKKAEKFQEKLS